MKLLLFTDENGLSVYSDEHASNILNINLTEPPIPRRVSLKFQLLESACNFAENNKLNCIWGAGQFNDGANYLWESLFFAYLEIHEKEEGNFGNSHDLSADNSLFGSLIDSFQEKYHLCPFSKAELIELMAKY